MMKLVLSKESSVNEVRKLTFMRKFQQEQKVIDHCLLPPCAENLRFHIMRANYVAGIYERANDLTCLDNPEDHGWGPGGATIWSNNVFPEDVKDALLECDDTENEECSGSDDSESDNEIDDIDD